MTRIWLVAFAAILVAQSAYAWHVNTHLQMTRDAISLMPAEFRKTFTDHQKFVEAGIKDPDFVLRDYQNHYYLPLNKEGGAIDRIEKLTQVVQTKFKTSSATDVSKQLCYLAHYVADLWSPEHLIKQDTGGDHMFVYNNTIVVVFEGYNEPIQDIRGYFQQRSEWRWKLESSRDISTLLYNEAVNDIARVWLTLWQQNGKTVEQVAPASIEHSKGTFSAEELPENAQPQWKSTAGPLQKLAERAEEMKKASEAADGKVVPAKAPQKLQLQMSQLNAASPFEMLETSLKIVDGKGFFVGRIRNKSNEDISGIAFVSPGSKEPVAELEVLKSKEVGKFEAIVPANVTKDQIKIVFEVT